MFDYEASLLQAALEALDAARQAAEAARNALSHSEVSTWAEVGEIMDVIERISAMSARIEGIEPQRELSNECEGLLNCVYDVMPKGVTAAVHHTPARWSLYVHRPSRFGDQSFNIQCDSFADLVDHAKCRLRGQMGLSLAV